MRLYTKDNKGKEISQYEYNRNSKSDENLRRFHGSIPSESPYSQRKCLWIFRSERSRKILGLPKSSVDDALELVGLTEFRKRLAKKYSLGMKQRLGLAGALIGRPPILILDEPTNGLDPVGIHEIRTLIRSLPQKYDCTVLVSSHLLPEVELMADDIGILNHGHLLFEGTKEELKTSARAAGFPTDNLEDTFLAMIDEDNRRRGGTV